MIVHCTDTKMVPIYDLKPHPKNRNSHPKEQIERLAQILKYQGWRYPIKVSNRSGFITSGHGRIEAARVLGLTEVPVSYQDYESEEQEYADIVADNAIASWSELDFSGINTDIGDLGPFDIDLLGIKNFTVEALDKFEPQCDEDEVPDNVEPIAKLGDIYQLGRHRLMCGDSTSIDAVEKLMNGEKADMVFTDPPYNVAIVGGCKNPLNSNYQSGARIQNDSMANDDFRQFLRDFYSSAHSVTKPGGVIYVCHADLEVINFRSAMVESGWLMKQCLIWVKHAFVFGRQDYHWQHEPILYGRKEGAGHKFYGERNQSTVWNFNRPGPSDKSHPTMKPVDLIEKGILNSTESNQIVFDSFGGSGSTLIACEKTNRTCFMMELDPKYCDVIIARWEKYTGKKSELINGAS